MWKDDNDLIDQILDDFKMRKLKVFPTKCPICKTKQAHIYMHRWKDGFNKGGSWIWCSYCQNSSHGSINIPEWWRNCEKIEFDKLGSHPDYLEKMKEIVDFHVENLDERI